MLDNGDDATRVVASGPPLIIDVGHAPEITTTSDNVELFSRHAVYNDFHGDVLYVIRFDTLTWVGDVPAPVKPWPLAADWEIVSGSAFGLQPVFRNNPVARGEIVAPTFEGGSWIGTEEAYTGAMGFGVIGQRQGDGPMGIIRSRRFTVTGNSMNLLVGGGSYPDECYVALVEDGTTTVLFKETGNNFEEMSRRYWNLVPHIGKTVYIEIADLSSAEFGHINVDDIIESNDVVDNGGTGTGSVKDRPGRENVSSVTPLGSLFQNTPNPFNPTTTISYQLLAAGHARIDIFSVVGKRVRTLTDGPRAPGTHSVVWMAENDSGERVKSGIYFYRLTVNGAPLATRKMVLLK